MTAKRIILSILVSATLAQAQKDWRKADGPVKIYNTAKKKLMEGKQIVGVTISSPDPNIYCAAANSGYDYTWIELQHSPLISSDVAKMSWACRGATAMPFMRVPDATESEIQKAPAIGAVAVLVPTVEPLKKAQIA